MIILRDNRWPIRDVYRRKLIAKYELNKIILRSLLSFTLWSKKYRFYFAKKLNRFTKCNSISFCRNYCFLRVMGRSTFRFSRMSRHLTKYYASYGFIVGLRKSSF